MRCCRAWLPECHNLWPFATSRIPALTGMLVSFACAFASFPFLCASIPSLPPKKGKPFSPGKTPAKHSRRINILCSPGSGEETNSTSEAQSQSFGSPRTPGFQENSQTACFFLGKQLQPGKLWGGSVPAFSLSRFSANRGLLLGGIFRR